MQIQTEEHKLPPHPTGPQQKFRKDYAPPPYTITNVHLDFILGEEVTHVHSRLNVVPNYGQLAEGELGGARAGVRSGSVRWEGRDGGGYRARIARGW